MSRISRRLFFLALCCSFNTEGAERDLDQNPLLSANKLHITHIVDRGSEEWLKLKLAYSGYMWLLQDIMNGKEPFEKMAEVSQGMKVVGVQGYPAALITFDILRQCGFDGPSIDIFPEWNLNREEIVSIVEHSLHNHMVFRFIQLHKSKFKTQSNLADWLYVSQSTISRFLGGKPSPLLVSQVKENLIEHYVSLLSAEERQTESKKSR